MTAHACKSLTDGCYRCDLNRDEMESIAVEVRVEAQDAWLAYRDRYSRQRGLNPRRAASQMRRREFIAGYLAAEGIS